ncbi:dihydrodipicolinate synthase family protein [Sulfobacillus harzensis]|uniref:Dihydrodipicolinate synthase family protein n=1 Tax=Sulfobacillus harzensis TaxID=2729629 RepID=A0A7Y0L417_9FIRM|nr:dihydrodipicolinate synthase family protein [Sulfobacillus harzensis]
MRDLSGIICPMLTPTTKEGEIAVEGVTQLVRYILDSGCQGVMIAGTTGEFPYLSDDQWRILVQVAVSEVGRTATTVVNVSHNSLPSVRMRMEWASNVGADYIASVVPGYFPLTDEEVIRYYATLARESPLPVIVYNIPQRTGVDTRSVMKELSQTENIIGMKDSSEDRSTLNQALSQLTNPFPVILGADDPTVLREVPNAVGIVPGLANVLPELYSRWWAALKNENLDETTEFRNHIRSMIECYAAGQGSVAYIQVLRVAMELIGVSVGDPLFPGSPAPRPLLELVRERLQKIESRPI